MCLGQLIVCVFFFLVETEISGDRFEHVFFYLAGALLDYKPKINNLMYEFAVNDANENILQETGLKLTVETREIEYRNEFSAAQKLCELLTVCLLSVGKSNICLHPSVSF